MAGFIENRGQFDSKVNFQLTGVTKTLWVTGTGLLFDIAGRASSNGESANLKKIAIQKSRFVFAEDFQDARLDKCRGLEPLPGMYNFLSDDPRPRTVGIRAFREIVAEEIWPGIDLRLSVTGSDIEQQFIVKPGGDPSRIRISYRGVRRIKISKSGFLNIDTDAGQLREAKPTVYQDLLRFA